MPGYAKVTIFLFVHDNEYPDIFRDEINFLVDDRQPVMIGTEGNRASLCSLSSV